MFTFNISFAEKNISILKEIFLRQNSYLVLMKRQLISL